MIEDLLSPLNPENIIKVYELSNQDKFAKSYIIECYRQLREYLYVNLQEKFVQISMQNGFPEYLEKQFAVQLEEKLLNDIGFKADQMKKIDPQYYLDFLRQMNEELNKIQSFVSVPEIKGVAKSK